ncbi:MAG: hypothetical protein L3J43_01825 [Sulfurovum sp.]|nr:hypothetical protein [Sulfurovum sp.]
MKNILILASGSVAKHFIDWVDKKRVADNHYYVTNYKEGTLPEKVGKNITLLDIDPTSFSKLNHVITNTKFANVFVILEDKEDAEYTLKNIALINPNTRTVFVNQWDDKKMGKACKNITIFYSDELMAAHLYDHLPNVPLVAQNVGLGRGEIMEIHVPFGSSYAYRHVGSVLQRRWKIAALYRDEMQILPTPATMIQPNDTLLVVGKPRVLHSVYKTINKRTGLFPEPFGKNLYFMIDMRFDNENILMHLRESIYLLDKLENKSLFIRVFFPNDFNLLEKLKKFESDKVSISISYDSDDIDKQIEYDLHEHDIGLVLIGKESFEVDNHKEILYNLKKLVYLFGDRHLYNIKKCIVLMSENNKMESISATAFEISESLGLNLLLGDYDPEGEFEEKKITIEHFETLSQIFNIEIEIEQKVSNPIRKLSSMNEILQVLPFEKELNTNNFIRLISTKMQDLVLSVTKHPKLLVPFELSEFKEQS